MGISATTEELYVVRVECLKLALGFRFSLSERTESRERAMKENRQTEWGIKWNNDQNKKRKKWETNFESITEE